MQVYSARWCHVCLRPIDNSERNVVLLFLNEGEHGREVIVHGGCYDASDPAFEAPRFNYEARLRSNVARS